MSSPSDTSFESTPQNLQEDDLGISSSRVDFYETLLENSLQSDEERFGLLAARILGNIKNLDFRNNQLIREGAHRIGELATQLMKCNAQIVDYHIWVDGLVDASLILKNSGEIPETICPESRNRETIFEVLNQVLSEMTAEEKYKQIDDYLDEVEEKIKFNITETERLFEELTELEYVFHRYAKSHDMDFHKDYIPLSEMSFCDIDDIMRH